MSGFKRFRPDEFALGDAAPKGRKPKGTGPAPLNVAFFASLCARIGVETPVKEWRFHPSREWRFDVAWPKYKVALEVHGGGWNPGKSGHHTGVGAAADWEKLNAAQMLGWIVLQVPRTWRTKDDWCSTTNAELCKAAIELRTPKPVHQKQFDEL